MNSDIPVDIAKRSFGAHERRFRAVGAIHPPVIHASVVAHEELVDVLVRTRLEADDGRITRFNRDVAALRAARTNGSNAVELPRASLVQEILREQRPDGTQVHDVS